MASKSKIINLKDSRDKKKKNTKKELLKKKRSKKARKPKVKRTTPKQYLKEVQIEMKKVAWPSRPEVVVLSITVLIGVVIFSLFTFGLDALFKFMLQLSTKVK